MLRKIKIPNSGIGNRISHHITEMYRQHGENRISSFDELYELKTDLCNLQIRHIGRDVKIGTVILNRSLWFTND